MYKILPVAFLSLFSSTALAGSPIRTAGNFGLGIGGGYWFDGLSLKYFAGDHTALQGVIGAYGFGHKDGYGGLGLTGDYLWEMPAIADGQAVELGWDIGLGPSLGVSDHYLALGVHGTLGLEFNFKPIPIDLVLEYKPGLLVIPGLDADLVNFGAHIRVYPF